MVLIRRSTVLSVAEVASASTQSHSGSPSIKLLGIFRLATLGTFVLLMALEHTKTSKLIYLRTSSNLKRSELTQEKIVLHTK